MREQVVVPDRMRRRSALRRDREIAALVLDPHQRGLPQLSALRPHACDDDDRQSGVAQGVGTGPTRCLVGLDLLADPVGRARLVLTNQWHVGRGYLRATGATGAPHALTNGSGVAMRRNSYR